ncbi:MAG TPA: hypothetical protein VFQ45_16990 [Longimicrobium sp.]|nr:hypothetical protein [Longimicrobium sp.]
MVRRSLLTLLLLAPLLAGCDLRIERGDNRPVHIGEFGPYTRRTMTAVLADGERVPVYRVKYWVFENGQDPPALQIEYEAPFPVRDTLRVRAFARRLWPTFMPYVKGALTDAALVTATNLVVTPDSARSESFTVVAERSRWEEWRLRGEAEPLEPGVLGRERIFEPDGTPLRIQALRTFVEGRDTTRTRE